MNRPQRSPRNWKRRSKGQRQHEDCRTGPASELAAHYTAHPPKGEIVLLVGPPVEQRGSLDADALLREALGEMSPSKAAGKVAKATGLDRQALYTRAVELKGA